MALKPIYFEVRLFSGDSPLEIDRSRRAMLWIMNAIGEINKEYIQTHPETPKLYSSGVIYNPEKTENWQDIPTTLAKGFGDCEDLAMYRIGELRAQGIKATPYVSWRNPADGGTIYHALVRHANGDIEDPSRALGMCGYFTYIPVIIGNDKTGL
jgi:hypothetical protein